MVSNRSRYVSESTTDEETGDMEYLPNNQQNKPPRKPTRTPKCFSKNALMARENRLKKKMYINSLEGQLGSLKNENKKLSHVVDSQSMTIDELKKEVKYLKSILANSESIGKLIRAINSSTGMAVSTSLVDKKPSLNNNNNSATNKISNKAPRTVPQMETVKQNKNVPYNSGFDFNRHPWEETSPASSPYEYVNYPTPESTTTSCYGSPEFEELNNEGLLLDMDIPLEMNNDDLLDMIDEKALESPMISVDEHNYTTPMKSEQPFKVKEEDDVGVCLHVSQNKVSLEFCPSCSGNAAYSWKNN